MSTTLHRRCPTAREGAEIRVFSVAGATAGEPDICIQVFRRIGHDIAAPMGPTAAAVRVPGRYVPRLIELLAEVAAEATVAEATVAETETAR